MAQNVRAMDCGPEHVFRVFEDGWLFPSWVVGASRMRAVDVGWPARGTRLHHSVGTWPLLLDDNTEVLEYEPPRRFVVQARGWPVGEARVTLEAKPHRGGTLVRIEEHASSGPAALVPKPLMDLAIRWRNTETLRRLAFIAEGFARTDRAAASATADTPVDLPEMYGADGVARTSEASRSEGEREGGA
ncbi:SRPBCC family protein [Microbacterium sp. GXF7504]